jgi:hypothetical protein
MVMVINFMVIFNICKTDKKNASTEVATEEN